MERKLLLWIWWWPTFPPHQPVLLLAPLKLCCYYLHQLSGKHRTPLTRSYQNLGEQHTSSSRARNFWFLATKSVSQFSSTRAAVPPFTLTPSRPWMRQEVVNCIYILDFFGCHGWWGLAPVRCFDPEALKPLPNLEPEWRWLSIWVKMLITPVLVQQAISLQPLHHCHSLQEPELKKQFQRSPKDLEYQETFLQIERE